MVTIKFQKGEPPLVFSDSIVLSNEEVAALSEKDIEAMKEERYQQWLAIVATPPVSDADQEQIVEEEPING